MNMSASLDAHLSTRLQQRHASGRHRCRTVRELPERTLDFAGNDYLGLALDPRLHQALAEGARRYGAGATASPLIGGQLKIHERLEAALAELLDRPRALLFPSGFQANLGVIGALAGRGDHTFHDRLNHASLLDGSRLSGARLERFLHADAGDLDARLSRTKGTGARLVVSDAVFSMDGDIAPLAELARVSRAHGAWLVIDDAHGVGVLGPRGGGAASAAGLSLEQVPVLVGTLSKAFGVQGAFVAGSESLIDALIQFARPYVYSTGLAPALANGALEAARIITTEPEHRQRLGANIAHLRKMAQAAGLTLAPSTTPIQPLPIGDERATMALAQALAQDGTRVGAIRPPTVPLGGSRLRITLSARHRADQIEQLVERIVHHRRALGLNPLTEKP